MNDCKEIIAKKCLQRSLCGSKMSAMNPIYTEVAQIRHHELIVESEQRRRRADARRVTRAARLRRRAAGINRKAAELLEATHR